MLTDAILIADERHMSEHSDDRSPGQLVNTAALPGIVGEAWGMADWHFGYGFPIGGVVATDVKAGEQGGAISPGGVWRGQAEEFHQRYVSRTPLGRMATEEDLKGAIAYLSSDLSRYVTGHNLVADGGYLAH